MEAVSVVARCCLSLKDVVPLLSTLGLCSGCCDAQYSPAADVGSCVPNHIPALKLCSSFCLSNAMHGHNINLPVCVCVSVCLSHFLLTRLQVRSLNGFLQLIA